METTVESNALSKSKTLLVVIAVLAYLLPVPYFAIIQAAHLEGLSVYFFQLGLYALFIGLAWWGIKREQLSLAFTWQKAGQALAFALVGWLVYSLVLPLTGAASLVREFGTLAATPLWKVALQILSTWLFVGLGEELLFRGYFLTAIRRYFTQGSERRRTTQAILLSSLVFSFWHIPVRIVSILNGKMDLGELLLSLVVLFLMGACFAYLYARTGNLLLVGLVHGLNDYALIGLSSQLQPLMLLVVIAAVEIARAVSGRRKVVANQGLAY
jgi:membrane protease YdiL (CAAX protease family)